MIGWMPAALAASANSRAPKRLPLSVIATAGMRSAVHSLISALMVMAPSDSE